VRGTLRSGVRDTRHPGVPTQTGFAEVEPDDSGSRLLPDGGSRELKRVIPPRESRNPSVEAVHGSLTETFSEGSDLDLLLVQETVRLGDDSRGNASDTRRRRQDLDSEVGKCYQLTAARLSKTFAVPTAAEPAGGAQTPAATARGSGACGGGFSGTCAHEYIVCCPM